MNSEFQKVVPRGSDGVVDWDSMAAHGPGASAGYNVTTLEPLQDVSHAGPTTAFASISGQTDSSAVGKLVHRLLVDGGAGAADRFGSFPLPPLLGPVEMEEIDSWARPIQIAGLSILPFRANGGARPAADAHLTVRWQTPAGTTLTTAPGWSISVYGPDGITEDGVSIEPVPGVLNSADVRIADTVVGDVVVRATLRELNGKLYMGRPILVAHRDPPGTQPRQLLTEFSEITLPVDARIPVRLGIEFSDGSRSLVFPGPGELTAQSDRPAVVDVTSPLEWRIRAAGTAVVTLQFRGLSQKVTVRGETSVPPPLPLYDFQPLADAEAELTWPATPTQRLQITESLNPPQWRTYYDDVVQGTRRQARVPMLQPQQYFRWRTDAELQPDPKIATAEATTFETGATAARERFGTTGRGVLVAILDRGIDWRNADFRKPDGTTRIRGIFDLTDPTGAAAAGNPYGKGTLYTEAQINAALAGGPALAHRDAVGHGTSTTGIAAGGGRNDSRFAGLAPEADLLVVKVTSDGAPAHDGEAAEPAFNDATAYLKGPDYVRDQARRLGQPCVMLLNLGSVNGPTDGTSELCRKIDSVVGPGIPGLAFVCGTSDDGGSANRAGGIVRTGETNVLTLHKGTTGSLFVDLWYPGADQYAVRLFTPQGSFGPFAAPGTGGFDTRTVGGIVYYQLTPTRAFYGAVNNKRELWLRIDGAAGDYRIELMGTVANGGRFDATMNPSRFSVTQGGGNYFSSNVAPGSIWDGATSLYTIVPNSYVLRTNYTDINGVARSIPNEGALGDLWLGSGVGPTFDGRLGVDVSAPGESVFTTYNPKSFWATARHNVVASRAGVYGRANAVSAANPQITGIVALMLEANPQLDSPTIKRLLQQSARADGFTGPVPNPRWGYGKVDALEAVRLAVESR